MSSPGMFSATGTRGQLHDAALDGVHQREVAHRPREEGALGISRSAQEEGGRREIDHPGEPELAVDRLQAGDPEAGGLVVTLSLLALVALEVVVIILVGRLLPVAMVRLVVQDEDVLQPHQLGHHALEHLALGLEGVQLIADAPLKQRAPALRQLHPLAALEGVIVGNDDLGAVDIVQHVGRHQLAARVVAVGVVRLKDAQAILDRDARGDHEKAAGEALALRPADGVDGLPGDEHGHDGGLPGTGSELEREAHELGVGVAVRVRQVLEESLPLPFVRSDLGEPDRGLHRFDLAEERTDARELVVSPVLKQPRCLRRHSPGARILDAAPLVYSMAQRVDDRVGIVLLLRGRDTGPLVEHQPLLGRAFLAFLRPGDRRDELGGSTRLDELTGRLPLRIEFPVARRVCVGRVEDRPFEKAAIHAQSRRLTGWGPAALVALKAALP